jgi:hypothetical protein
VAEQLEIRPECLSGTPLPPTHFETQYPQEAPVTPDRSFLSEMRLAFTPVDEVTGVTYPLVTERPLPPISKCQNEQGQTIADWNHNYHPKEKLSKGTPLERGLRSARIEWVHRDDHNSYHKQFYGPDISGADNMLKSLLFSAAGFIPEHGLQYDGREKAAIISLPPEQRLNLWKSGRVRISNTVIVRDALMDLALREDFSGINERTIDEFLSTNNLMRKRILGSTLLSMALHEVTEPLKLPYKQARQNQQLPPNTSRTAGKLALALIDKTRRSRALSMLETHLRAAA